MKTWFPGVDNNRREDSIHYGTKRERLKINPERWWRQRKRWKWEEVKRFIKKVEIVRKLRSHTHTHTHTPPHTNAYIYIYIQKGKYFILFEFNSIDFLLTFGSEQIKPQSPKYSYKQTCVYIYIYIYIYIFTNLISTSIHGTRKKKRKKTRQEQEIKVSRITARGKKKKYYRSKRKKRPTSSDPLKKITRDLS